MDAQNCQRDVLSSVALGGLWFTESKRSQNALATIVDRIRVLKKRRCQNGCEDESKDDYRGDLVVNVTKFQTKKRDDEAKFRQLR